MNKHLKPLTSERAHEIGRLGGLVRSDNKRYAQLIKQSPKAMCKNCKAICLFKENNLSISKNYKCIIPNARAKAIFYDTAVMNEEILDKMDADTIMVMATKCDRPKDLKRLHDCIMNKKKVDYHKLTETSIMGNNVTINFNENYMQFKDIVFNALKSELTPEQSRKVIEKIKISLDSLQNDEDKESIDVTPKENESNKIRSDKEKE